MDEFKRPEIREAQRVELRESDVVNEIVQTPASNSDSPIPGGFIKQYKVLSHLGSGGMSDVYKCEDMSLHRTVAIKLVRAARAGNEELVRRFQTEGRALAKLEHPNIVKVHGLEATNEGLPFLVMEYVPGISLDSILSSGRKLPVTAAVRLAAQTCDALKAAHDAGIIHRDLKPSNIIILNAGHQDEQIKLLDFGIAKIQDDLSKDTTKTGEIFGTPQYMSPEQAQGKKCDSRSDQYSLGCILYEMLTGKPPFDRDNQMASLMARVHENPPSLSSAEHFIPKHVQQAVEKLMARQPEDRFLTVDDAKRALLGETKIVVIRPQAKRYGLIALALVGCTLAGFLLVTMLPRHEDVPTGSTLVQNGTFEATVIAPQQTNPQWKELRTKDVLPGWTIDSGSVDVVDNSGWEPAEGSASLDLNGENAGTISQTIATTPGAKYVVEFQAAFNPQLFDGASATFEISAADQSRSLRITVPKRSAAEKKNWKMFWQPEQWSFVAHGPKTNLKFHSSTDLQCGPCIDDVKVFRARFDVVNEIKAIAGQ